MDSNWDKMAFDIKVDFYVKTSNETKKVIEYAKVSTKWLENSQYAKYMRNCSEWNIDWNWERKIS